jgi:peptide/nickel transport system permease protein
MIIPVLVGISLLIFLLIRLIPGDVIDSLLGMEATLSPEVRTTLRKMLGLDAPFHIQYLRWVWDLVHGDLGRSFRTGHLVAETLLYRIPVTVELALLSVLLAMCFAVPLGVFSAVFPNGKIDFLVRLLGLVGLSFPNFWLATMLILISSLYFNWLPPLIFISPWADPVGNLAQMALPAVSLALALMAIVMRMTRSSLLEVLRQEYIQTARAKGLMEGMVVFRHALKNAFIPVITVVGIQAGFLLGGAVIVEQIFGLPGLGWMLLNAIYQRDYPVIQGAVLFISLMFILANLFVDILYSYLDPRIRYQ